MDVRCPVCSENYYRGYKEGSAAGLEALIEVLRFLRLGKPITVKLEEAEYVKLLREILDREEG